MMLCDELKPLIFSISDLAYVDEIRVTKNFQNPHDHAVYKATEVDAAIAELKDENHKLRRALYKACANWARSERYTEATWHGDEHREELWANVQAKCLNKAEEYK